MRWTHLFLLVALPLAACEDPADSVPTARIEDTPDTPEGEGEPEEADGALAIDTDASTFEFIGSKVTQSHTGHFGEWSGSIDLRDPFEESAITIEIQMGTIEADVARLTRHLRTDDFFDVAQYPTARFVSAAIAPAPEGSGDATHLVTGRLTIRDTTQTITFPTQITITDQEVRAQARFAIDRQRWGISYRGMEDDLIRDQVVILFDVRAPRG